MKKILSLSIILAAGFSLTSCVNEEDDLFDHSAAERLNQLSDIYSARLEAQPNGWAMQYYPTNEEEAPYGSGYLILCDFDPDGSVKVAMDNIFSGNNYSEDRSLWEVITDNGPVLSFNSYNKNMHAFSNPEDLPFTGTSEEANNEQGKGAEGDYEFIVVDAPEDASYMMLKGKKRGTYNLLTPIEQGVVYEDYLADVKAFHNAMFPPEYISYDILHAGDEDFVFKNANSGVPIIYPVGGDEVTENEFHPFLTTKRGDDYYIRFRDKQIVYYTESGAPDDESLQTYQELKYNPETDRFESTTIENVYLEGSVPVDALKANFDAEHVYYLGSSSEMSDKMKTLFDDMSNGFTKIKYSFNSKSKMLSLSPKDGVLSFRLNTLNAKRRQEYYNFSYNYVFDGETLEFSGLDLMNTDKAYNTVEGLSAFINVFGQKFVVSEVTTRFNLTELKLVAANDPDLWFVLKY